MTKRFTRYLRTYTGERKYARETESTHAVTGESYRTTVITFRSCYSRVYLRFLCLSLCTSFGFVSHNLSERVFMFTPSRHLNRSTNPPFIKSSSIFFFYILVIRVRKFTGIVWITLAVHLVYSESVTCAFYLWNRISLCALASFRSYLHRFLLSFFDRYRIFFVLKPKEILLCLSHSFFPRLVRRIINRRTVIPGFFLFEDFSQIIYIKTSIVSSFFFLSTIVYIFSTSYIFVFRRFIFFEVYIPGDYRIYES